MKSTGVIRHVDALGRVVSPKEIRRAFQIGKETSLWKYLLAMISFF